MGAAPAGEPMLFLKPASSVIGDGEAIVIPPGVGEVHHEVELGVVIGARCSRVLAGEALARVLGYAVLIDVTARDLQAAARKQGLPWTLAKGLDTFCPISAVMPAAQAPDPASLALRLLVNGELRQQGKTADMLWSVPALIEFISARITLERGDVIATGTPQGVAALVPGDLVEARIEGVGALRCTVASGEPPRQPFQPC
ncbi:MAG: fumarylacetoacetate hydrolase family protein [Planctomycetes bacterium]|nr:fumarylacetoacetate hydrolase family protein [Planctomycetota bacterium]